MWPQDPFSLSTRDYNSDIGLMLLSSINPFLKPIFQVGFELQSKGDA